MSFSMTLQAWKIAFLNSMTFQDAWDDHDYSSSERTPFSHRYYQQTMCNCRQVETIHAHVECSHETSVVPEVLNCIRCTKSSQLPTTCGHTEP